VISLGGGVAGDTVGFVAATYLRGVPFVQVPTTLLAMVDASVGGKVGVNVPQGKNLIGAFYQPLTVIIDPDVLSTLPPREFSAGIAECIKHSIIRDASLLDWMLEKQNNILNLETETLETFIARNVEIKAKVVEEDEKESGVRAHLNLGHTFGHAIERECGFGVHLHGEAVALGCLAAFEVARRRNLVSSEQLAYVRGAVEAFRLPTAIELPDDEKLLAAMSLDKKVKGGKIRLVLPVGIGDCAIVDDASKEEIELGLSAIRA
jgi:3-dehydroquinate synthase